MSSKEKAVVAVFSLMIVGSIAYLLLFAPLGSLGSADGQSFEVDRFCIIGYLVLFLAVGFFAVRWHVSKEQKKQRQMFELQECVWPPPPQIEEPGTGSAGLLSNESVSDTAEW